MLLKAPVVAAEAEEEAEGPKDPLLRQHWMWFQHHGLQRGQELIDSNLNFVFCLRLVTAGCMKGVYTQSPFLVVDVLLSLVLFLRDKVQLLE